MHFNIFTIATAALATQATALVARQSDVTADDVSMAIDKITNLSNDTNNVAMNITFGPSAASNGFKVVNNFRKIVEMVTMDIKILKGISGGGMATPSPTPMPTPDPMVNGRAALPDGSPFPEVGQQQICAAFVTFVEVHQALLRTVIGKKGILSLTPVSAPMGAVLRLIEGGVDTIAFTLIGLVPTCADEAQAAQMRLDKTLKDSEAAYPVPGGM